MPTLPTANPNRAFQENVQAPVQQQPAPQVAPPASVVNPNSAFQNNVQPLTTPVPSTSLQPTPSITTPQPTAPAVQQNYFAGVANDVQSTQDSLQTEYDNQNAAIKTQQDTLKAQQQQELDAEQQLSQPYQQQLEQTQEQQLGVNSNFQKNQGLADELNSLVSEATQRLSGQNGREASLDSIDAGYNRTLSDITARAGLIQSAMSAYSGQISAAYTQIDRSVAAINADRTDQINYYQTLLSLNNQGQLDLNGQAKTIAQDKITDLQKQADDAQSTADNIKQAMLDPDTAQAYAQAGVTLTDTPEQINTKLSDYAYSQELAKSSQTMAQQGYSAILPGQSAPPSAQVLTVTDSRGNQKQYYTIPKTTAASTVTTDGGGGTGVSGLTDDATNFFAQMSTTGVNPNTLLPSLGVGAAGLATKTAILNQISQNAQTLGIDGQTFGAMLTDSKAKGAAYAALQKTGSQTEVNAANANKDLAQAVQLSETLDASTVSSSVPLINSWLRTGQVTLGGNADVNNFVGVLTTALTEYAKVVSGQTGGAAVTQEANAQAQQLLSKGMSTATIQSFAQTAQQEMNNRTTSYNSALTNLFGDIQSVSDTSGGLGQSASSKGSQTDSDFVAAALQTSGASYNSVIDNAPAGQIAVVDNSSGQIGYIPVSEFDASTYTKM